MTTCLSIGAKHKTENIKSDIRSKYKGPYPYLRQFKKQFKKQFTYAPEFPHSHYPHSPTPCDWGPAQGQGPGVGGWGTWGGGVGIMGMWEFGGICELLFKLFFKLPKVGVGASIFAPW